MMVEAVSLFHCLFVCCRNLDLFYDFDKNEFDSIIAELENETNMADIMRELGYGCTLSTAHCMEVLSLFLPISEVTLPRILCTIARTHVGLEDNQTSYSTFCSAIGSSDLCDSSSLSSWNVDVLVDSIKQLVSSCPILSLIVHFLIGCLGF